MPLQSLTHILTSFKILLPILESHHIEDECRVSDRTESPQRSAAERGLAEMARPERARPKQKKSALLQIFYHL